MKKQLNNEMFWYALRVTYSRELTLKSYLDRQHIENFVPMCYKYVFKNGQKIRKLVPAVHNLIFVRSTRCMIDEIKKASSFSLPLRYIMNRETHCPIVIPETQMQHFIAVAGSHHEQVVYLSNVTFSAKKGDRVRITAGFFEGVEGLYLRVKGDRRVVVAIQGVMAVATAFIHPSLLEPVGVAVRNV